MAQKPTIYLLHGDDEYAIAQQISAMEAKLGDPTSADLNTTHFEKGELDLSALAAAAQAVPFMAERRLVVLHDPLASFKSSATRDRFKSFLENIPATTAFVIVVTRPLLSYQDKKHNKRHWLQKWAAGQGKRVYEKEYLLPRGHRMIAWIQTQARNADGEITPQAASVLARLVDDTPRVAAQELGKLLAYVNYSRPVDVDDVEHLAAYHGEGDVFEMVDALGNQDGQKALEMLHRLLEQDAPLRLFGMIVRQFRLLLLTRELLNSGYRGNDIARKLKVHPYVASKIVPQTRNFSIETLETIYRQLLDIDEAIKTGKIDADVALDTLTVALTA
ncbi:MAG: DNA polymerase III subunit delta [Chloroflexota bacterium]|nr:DNA polymerase III subunit delta [Chloroflexota bacterium]